MAAVDGVASFGGNVAVDDQAGRFLEEVGDAEDAAVVLELELDHSGVEQPAGGGGELDAVATAVIERGVVGDDEARRRLTVFYDHCNSSGVPELERLARTIARWETPILRWHRTRLTNAGTEGTNLIVKNIKRLGFGFRNFENYRLRLLLRCGAPWQHRPVAPIRPRHPRISA